jgi:hypothetical protein
MSAARRAVFAIFCFSVCAHAQTRTLAVYSGPGQRLESSAVHALQTELQRVMTPADIEVTWVPSAPDKRESPEFQLAVVGTFDGDCSVENLPEQPGRTVRDVKLAESSVSNGRVFPFFRVDCDHIIQTLSPDLRSLSVPMRENILGRALARAIAHEIYHILGQTTGHEKSGIAKASLSRSDLYSAKFDFNSESLLRMQARPSRKLSRDVLAVLTSR